jgi:hypothetical protein
MGKFGYIGEFPMLEVIVWSYEGGLEIFLGLTGKSRIGQDFTEKRTTTARSGTGNVTDLWSHIASLKNE